MVCSRCIAAAAQSSRPLQVGDEVQVQGLVANADLYGMLGRLVASDGKADRVHGCGSKGIKIKNLQIVRAAGARHPQRRVTSGSFRLLCSGLSASS